MLLGSPGRRLLRRYSTTRTERQRRSGKNEILNADWRSLDHPGRITDRHESRGTRHLSCVADNMGLPVRGWTQRRLNLNVPRSSSRFSEGSTPAASSRRAERCRARAQATRHLRIGSQSERSSQRPVQFEITSQTRNAVSAWIERATLRSEDFLFPSRGQKSEHLSRRQYARIVRAGSHRD
jgi:hypothetical protein